MSQTATIRVTASTAAERSACTVPEADRVGTKKALALWRRNDPAFLQVLRAGNHITFMESVICEVENGPDESAPCDVAGHDISLHRHNRLFGFMARLYRETIAVKALTRAARGLGIAPVDLQHLAPFHGSPICNANRIPAHIVSALRAFGIPTSEYVSWRSSGAHPQREDIDYNFRFMEEECAKLLRTLHAVAAKRAALAEDPEVGPVPTSPTERRLLDGADLTKLRAFLAGPVSGHAFHDASFIEAIGLQPHVAPVLVRTFKSDTSDHMRTIFAPGGVVLESIVAVRELELLWLLANEVDADVREAATKYGRGTRAQLLARSILTRLGH